MYVSFFGLKQAPFSIAPDPRYLFMSERHREALAHLLYGLGGGGGFVLLTGEVGAGKTTVCRCFLEQVPADCQVAYIFNPKLTVIELLQTVAQEFRIARPTDAPPQSTVKDYIDPLNSFLLAEHAAGRHCVLVIDEAQNLSADVLEQLRLLTNLETHERKLLQIVLIGQPELRELLARPELAQLAQRVAARYHLAALSEAETRAYVAHRMAVAGLRGALPLDGAALRQIHRRSGGIPRRINLLTDRALLGAYAEGRVQVGARTVARAAAEVFDTAMPGDAVPRWHAFALLAVATLVLAGVLGLAARGGAGLPGIGGVPTVARPPASTGAASATAGWADAAAAASAPSSAPHDAPHDAPLAASQSAALAGPPMVPRTSEPLTEPPSAPTFTAAPPEVGAALPVAAAANVQLALTDFPHDEGRALADLLPLWQLPPDAEPCRAGAVGPVLCFRSTTASLALLRALDRPGLLLLRSAGTTAYAQLLGLGARHVTLAAGERRWRVPLEDLAGQWHGEFITLWRAPANYRSSPAPQARGEAVDLIASALAQVRNERPPAPGQAFDEVMARRLAGFQLAWGLKPDGLAGPTTFMQLNRALGLAEPTLTPER